MKKILYTAIFVGALAMTSCSEDSEPAYSDSPQVSIRVNAPDAFTRSDGTWATNLYYMVYEISDGTTVMLTEEPEVISVASYPVSIPAIDVLRGHSYGVLLWASAYDSEATGPYTISWEEGTMTVDYTKAYANNPDLDAFYAYQTFKVDGNVSLSVDLERPFAMINIGTSTAPASGSTSTISVSDVPSSINLFTGKVTGTASNAEFVYTKVPVDTPYPVDGYTYLAYTYVLAPKVPSTSSNITYFYKEGNNNPISGSVEGVALQANYRTNIYGALPSSN